MELDRMFSTLDIAGSALHAERTRMNVVANNLALANVTSKTGTPPSRQAVIFRAALGEARHGSRRGRELAGVEVAGVTASNDPPRLVHDPSHADANDEGYVAYPNISAFQEMANLISASRSYGANLAVVRTYKEMMNKTLNIGR